MNSPKDSTEVTADARVRVPRNQQISRGSALQCATRDPAAVPRMLVVDTPTARRPEVVGSGGADALRGRISGLWMMTLNDTVPLGSLMAA